MKEQACVMQVGLKKYAAVSPSAFGLVGRKRIAVIRSAGAIVGGASCEPCYMATRLPAAPFV